MLARTRFVKAAALLALTAALGCSGGGGPHATVSGTVTHNNQPLNGAKVTFHSTTQAEGHHAGPYSVLTDSDGKYLLANVGKEAGIPPGMYKVTITKLDQEGTDMTQEGMDQGQLEASGTSVNVLPLDYESLATTKLSVTLQEGKNQDVNFDLKGTPGRSRRHQGVP